MAAYSPNSFFSKKSCSRGGRIADKASISPTSSCTSSRGRNPNRSSGSPAAPAHQPTGRRVSPGSLTNRQNIVVSSEEIRSLFDSIKGVGDLVKQQNSKIEKLERKLETSNDEIVGLREQTEELKNTIETGRQENEGQRHFGPIPKELKDDVHLLHNQQDLERQFDGSQGVGSAHNNSVKAFLLEQLVKENSTYSKATIKRAINTYYETKRQQFLDNLPERRDAAEKKQRDKKMTSRRRRLFLNRLKVANEAEKERIRDVGAIAMSDEEDGAGDQNGSWIVRSPVWRSPQLNTIILETQRRLEEDASSSHPKNKRITGPPSSRGPPPNLPSWALKENVQSGRKERNILPRQDERHSARKEVTSQRKESRAKKTASRRESVHKETTCMSVPRRESNDAPSTSTSQSMAEKLKQLVQSIQSDESDQESGFSGEEYSN